MKTPLRTDALLKDSSWSFRKARAGRSLLRAVMGVALLKAALYINPALAATLLVYGDSLSAGYGLRTGEGWVSLLEERLHDQKFNDDVVNASMSGETSAGGASRITRTLSRSKPSVVILELGANDGLRGLPIPQMKANLGRIIEACRMAGATVVLVGMQLPPNYGSSYSAEFARAFPDLARQYKLPLVPFMLQGFAERRDAFQSDGLHPRREFQRQILDNIWPVLKPTLKPARQHAAAQNGSWPVRYASG